MKTAKTTTETVSAAIEGNGKTILDKILILLNTDELSPKHKVMYGSFTAHLDRHLLPGFYRLLLEDGRSYRIVIKGVHPRREENLVRFLVVPEE